MSISKIIKSTQEQATAAWIDYLNRIRIFDLIRKLEAQDINFQEAMAELQKLKDFIGNPEHILGSDSTKHGEIAENVDVHVGNARRLIQGLKRLYSFDGVGRTAPEDYMCGDSAVQSKFLQGPIGNNSFRAIREHFAKYPDYLKNGGEYVIPKDQHEKIMELLSRPSSQLSKSENTLVEHIRQWEQENGISFADKVKPSIADYADVQQGTIQNTIAREEESLQEKDEEIRKAAHDASKPTLKEGAKVAAVSAAIEGGVAFVTSVAAKRKDGKKLTEFTAEDWKEVGLDTGKGNIKGGIRGGTVYYLTNFTPTPAPVASGLVTAAFGVTAQLEALRTGKITEKEFLVNSEAVCLEVAISTIASTMGSVLIPIPVLGTIIGNAVGMYMYDIIRECADAPDCLNQYLRELREHNDQLEAQYRALVLQLEAQFRQYQSLLDLALSTDVNKALQGSIAFAKFNGVAEENILKNKREIDAYFLN